MLTAHANFRFPVPDEKTVQRDLLRLFAYAGCLMGSTSQYRASRVLEGLPDLVGWHLGIKRFLWWESKAPVARWRDRDADPWIYYSPYHRATWRSKPLSVKQQEFREAAVACGELHGWGGIVEAETFLIELGLANRLASGVIQLGARRAG